MIYLASPYSHPDPAVREDRFQQACAAAAHLMREKLMVFSPIAHSHPMTFYGLPGDWEYWNELYRFWIEHSDQLVVLCIDGWRESTGVIAEIKIAQELCIPVSFLVNWPDAPLIVSVCS